MAPVAIAAEPWTERRRRTAELRRRYPFAVEVLDFYGALLGVQQGAYDDARAASPPAADVIAYAADRVVPLVAEVSFAAGPAALGEAVRGRLEMIDVRSLLAGWARGDEQPWADRFLARASLAPVLEAVAGAAAQVCAGPHDRRHCPQCGGPPQVSYFALAAEDLAAGGRFLMCARCSGVWGYPRMTCPGCGEDTSSRLPIFNEEGTTSGERGSVVRGLQGRLENHDRAGQKPVFPHIRIEACETCLHYLLNVDLAADPRAVPIVDEMAGIPLDLVARERGLSKITPNLMGF